MALPSINASAIAVLDVAASASGDEWLLASDVADDAHLSIKGVWRARRRLRLWGLIEEAGTSREPVLRATSMGRLLIDSFHDGEVIDAE